jgi:hypothetical protein
VGVSFQYRAGPFVGGALLEVGGVPFGYGFLGAASLAGVGFRPVTTVRFEMLGLIGIRGYGGVGTSFYGSDTGAGGLTAYAGARAGISYLFGKKLKHFELGVYGDLEDDLSRQYVHYTYTVDEDGSPSCCGTADHVIGMARLGFGIELGGAYDVL